MVPPDERTEDMRDRYAQGAWWHGAVVAPADEAGGAASGRRRGRLSVQSRYDGADEVDCIDIEQEHVVWLLRRNGPKAATAS